MSHISMKAVEARLPASEFIRIHRSFIVRKDRIRSIERSGVVVCDANASMEGRRIPVGENYREQLRRFMEGGVSE